MRIAILAEVDLTNISHLAGISGKAIDSKGGYLYWLFGAALEEKKLPIRTNDTSIHPNLSRVARCKKCTHGMICKNIPEKVPTPKVVTCSPCKLEFPIRISPFQKIGPSISKLKKKTAVKRKTARPGVLKVPLLRGAASFPDTSKALIRKGGPSAAAASPTSAASASSAMATSGMAPEGNGAVNGGER